MKKRRFQQVEKSTREAGAQRRLDSNPRDAIRRFFPHISLRPTDLEDQQRKQGMLHKSNLS